MPLNINELLQRSAGRNYDLHREHVNPRFASVLKTIGYDRCYVRAEGQYLWDTSGQRYLDLLGGYAVFNCGRNHPAIRQALIDFMNADYPSLVQMEAPLLSGLLAEELKRRIGRGLDIVYFTNSGAEGVETAIKFARCATGKHVVVHCDKAFHGLTTGAVSLNGDASFRDGFGPFLPESRQIPFNDLNALEGELLKGDVGAFIVEPVQGKGVHLPARGYLNQAAQLCRKHGALFIVDEVQTGIGRTGRFLAIDHETPFPHGHTSARLHPELGTQNSERPLEPDIVILSKALSGGYVPIGAVLMRRWIYDKVFSSLDRAVVHSSTFGQGSLAMVAALASLNVLDDEDLCANAERMGALFREGVESMMSRFEFIREVRQRGLMIGIQFDKPRSLGLRTAWALIHGMDANLFPQAVTMPLLDNHHILTQVAGHRTNCVKFIPPLILTEGDVQHFLDAFEAVMKDLHKFPGPVWSVLKKLGKHAVTQRSREFQAAGQ